MAEYRNARPGGYEEDSDDEFDGFEFGTGSSYDAYVASNSATCTTNGGDFVPSVETLVMKGNDSPTKEQLPGAVFDSSPKSSHDHPTPANTSSGSVKFSLDNTSTNEFSRNFDDIIVENGHAVDKESPIAPANQIRENHAGVPRLSPTYRTRRFQRESASRKRSNRQPRSEQVSKEKLRQTEEGENLRIAIQRGRTEEVRRILESGFDPNTKLSSGWTALMHACDLANLDITLLLLDHGANPRTRIDQYSALMALCACKTESKGRIETARLLINRGAIVNSHDRHKMSPLLYACQSGHLGLAELLISVNADVNKQDSRGWTPLHYAASQGNHQLVKLLVDSNAKPDVVCNLGDSPASVAYSNNHAALCDWLESITSSSKGAQSVQSDFPPHPLFGDVQTSTKVNSARVPTDGDVIMTSSPSSSVPVFNRSEAGLSSRDDHYGDLELFLYGEQLGHLIPLFKKHRVEFGNLLSMTDTDLLQMGISEVGVRKKILVSVAEVHKKEWHMPSNTIHHNKPLSALEAAVILSNLSRHSSYIKATTSYLLSHVRTNMNTIGPHLLPNERDKLNSDLSGAVAAVSSLREEMLSLQTELHSVLSQGTPTSTNSDALPVRRSRSVLLVKLIGGVGLITCVVYVTGKALFKYVSSR